MRSTWVVLASLVLIIGCAHSRFARFGASRGVRTATEISGLIDALRTFNRVDAAQVSASPAPTPAVDLLHQYFGSAYDGDLVDLIYFVDVSDGTLATAHVHVALTRGNARPSVLADEQNAWALVFFAVPAGKECGVVADLSHETIAPTPSPSETGLISALLGLVKLEAKAGEVKKPDDVRALLALPPSEACPKPKPGEPASVAIDADKDGAKDKKDEKDDKDKKEDKKDDKRTMVLLGKTASGVGLYAASVKLVLTSGTTNRVVLAPKVEDKPTVEFPIRGLTVTFRNASRPYFRATIGLGTRVDIKDRDTTNGPTKAWHAYDPDLYVLAHLLPPLGDWLREFQLRREWYPSLFVGTNVIARSLLADLVAGIRVPPLPGYKLGLAAGLDWAKYEYKVDAMCTKDCETQSHRKFALFAGVDYEF